MRTFNMGFVPCETDSTQEAKESIYAFIAKNSDLICHHMLEGVPWIEALIDAPYHPNVTRELDLRTSLTNFDKLKVFLYLTPLKFGSPELLGYWGEQSDMPLPKVWQGLAFDHPNVIMAYLNFCRHMIGRFQPTYFGYGIEINEVALSDKWPAFLRFAERVYGTLKQEFPTLPILASWQIDWHYNFGQNSALQEFAPFTDYLAVSTYPYCEYPLRNVAKNHFLKVANLLPDKPFAVAETGFIAQNLDCTLLGERFVYRGRSEWQNQYLSFMLTEAQKLDAKFVVWFVPQDLDRYYEAIREHPVAEQVLYWRDTGLVNGVGVSRRSMTTWKRWLKS